MNDNPYCALELETVVWQLVRQIQLFERDQIAIFGYTSSQYYMLLEISKSPNVAMNELSRKLNVAISTATRVIDKLEKKGLIERDRAEADRRVVLVSLTKTGSEILALIQQGVSQYYENIIANVPNGELTTTLECIKTLLAAFAKANPNCY